VNSAAGFEQGSDLGFPSRAHVTVNLITTSGTPLLSSLPAEAASRCKAIQKRLAAGGAPPGI
jgi:hypothetical protein